MHYSGNTQGRTHRESGPKGGLLVDVARGARAQVEFRPFGPVRFETVKVTRDRGGRYARAAARAHARLVGGRAARRSGRARHRLGRALPLRRRHAVVAPAGRRGGARRARARGRPRAPRCSTPRCRPGRSTPWSAWTSTGAAWTCSAPRSGCSRTCARGARAGPGARRPRSWPGSTARTRATRSRTCASCSRTPTASWSRACSSADGPARPMKVERIRIQAFGRLQDFDSGPRAARRPGRRARARTRAARRRSSSSSRPPCTASPRRRAKRIRTRRGAARSRPGSRRCGWRDGSALEVHRRAARDAGGHARARGPRRGDRATSRSPRPSTCRRAVFRQVYAITLARARRARGRELGGIQDRLIAGLGAADLRPARLVADELEEEAGPAVAPEPARHPEAPPAARAAARSGRPAPRRRGRRPRRCATRSASCERTRAELERARAEREAVEVYIERFSALRAGARVAAARARAAAGGGARRGPGGAAERSGLGYQLAILAEDAKGQRRYGEDIDHADTSLSGQRLTLGDLLGLAAMRPDWVLLRQQAATVARGAQYDGCVVVFGRSRDLLQTYGDDDRGIGGDECGPQGPPATGSARALYGRAGQFSGYTALQTAGMVW